jgi:hypothetical protein
MTLSTLKTPKDFKTIIQNEIQNSSLHAALQTWQQLLPLIATAEDVEWALDGIQNGFKLGVDHQAFMTDNATPSATPYRNLTTANDDPAFVQKRLSEELCAHRMMVLNPNEPMPPTLHVSPIGLVPKQPTGYRLIHHLSSPHGMSVNDAIDPDDARTEYGSVGNAIQAILQLGKGCVMFKVDLKDAFRHVRVHPDDVPLLGLFWNGQVIVDLCLPFGLRTAPAIFNRLSKLVAAMAVNLPAMHQCIVVQYLDDFWVAAPSHKIAFEAMAHMMVLFNRLGLTVNEGKCVSPTTRLTFLGVELDSVALTASLPDTKLTEIKRLVNDYTGRHAATRRELQSVAGVLFHAAKVAPAGRTFTHRLIKAAYTVPRQRDFVLLTQELKDDLSWWAARLKTWQGMSFFYTPQWLDARDDLAVETDASGSLGFGACFGSHWAYGHFPTELAHTSIQVKELYPIVVAAATWGHKWTTLRIHFRCDNQAVVHVLNKGYSTDARMTRLMRSLWSHAFAHNFTFRASHVPGLENVRADSLSRFKIDQFKLLQPASDPWPTKTITYEQLLAP